MAITLTEVIHIVAEVSLWASIARVGMHRVRGGLSIWLPATSWLWAVFDKTEDTLAYIAVSLEKLGKKDAVVVDLQSKVDRLHEVVAVKNEEVKAVTQEVQAVTKVAEEAKKEVEQIKSVSGSFKMDDIKKIT